ncbi:MAG: dicarboxylate/amino acid:cation symporter [Alistipes sp.]|nr:dicarboxylate/amino acid:cation symporter [Alistipes sp.]
MALKSIKIGLLGRVVIAILTGTLIGLAAPEWLSRAAATLGGLFGNFLGFTIPLIILGLVAPGIAELGRGAGKMLALTVGIAYGSTLFSGFFTYGACSAIFPWLLGGTAVLGEISGNASGAEPYFIVEMPPVMPVMSALILAFVLGLCLAGRDGVLKKGLSEFRDVVTIVIEKAIIPLLPLYIFCIFIGIASSGQVAGVMSVFIKIVAVIFVLHIALLLIYYMAAGAIAGGSPLGYLKTMLPAYHTALGTQSSAATIPVTLRQSIRNGVDPDVAGFVVPLCATIHLSGSIMKITGCALAIIMVTGMSITPATMVGFICLLGIAMVAAPGVPGGAIMAALGVLSSVLGFDQAALGLMIALYIAMDSFGTACNVTGDGAIAIVINKLCKKDKFRTAVLKNHYLYRTKWLKIKVNSASSGYRLS